MTIWISVGRENEVRIRELVLENYRGFPGEHSFDLTGQVILFYGPNGRGKSTVISALETALFPEEVVDQLLAEVGEDRRAPLTNRFSPRAEGKGSRIQIYWDDNRVLEQRLFDSLLQIRPNSHPSRAQLLGQRHRLFVTQRLLRDLMFGQPDRRYARMKQLLGVDAYDRLLWGIHRWAARRIDNIEELALHHHALTSLKKDHDRIIDELLKLNIPSIPGDLRENDILRSDAPVVAYRLAISQLGSISVDLTALVQRKRPPQEFSSLRNWLADATRRVNRLRRTISEVATKIPRLQSLDMLSSLPSAWSSQLEEIKRQFSASLDRSAELFNELKAALDPDQNINETADTYVRLFLRYLDDEGISKNNPRLSALQREFRKQVDEGIRLEKQAAELAESFMQVLNGAEQLLARYAEAAALLSRWSFAEFRLGRMNSSTWNDALKTIGARKQLADNLQAIYQELVDEVHNELVSRAKALEAEWRSYFAVISAQSHFGNLAVQPNRRDPSKSSQRRQSGARKPRSKQYQTLGTPPDAWCSLQFVAGDPDEQDKEHVFPMESLLSEGQLNCAVVSLALALAKGATAPPTPLKLLVLDDPFVSWDDVNLESFFTAIRYLAANGFQVILSTCDPRAVTSLQKNLETVDINNPATVYTLTDWDKHRGPSIEKRSVPRMPQSTVKWLSELSSEVFNAEPI